MICSGVGEHILSKHILDLGCKLTYATVIFIPRLEPEYTVRSYIGLEYVTERDLCTSGKSELTNKRTFAENAEC